MTGQRREYSMDFLKGICILLVVLCHTNGFHTLGPVPAALCEAVFLNTFFVVTGYISFGKLGEFDFSKTLRKFRSLFRPYVFFSVLAILWHMFLVFGLDCREVSDTWFGKQLILRDVMCAVSGIGIGTLWFLPVMFVCYVLLQGFVHITRKGGRWIVFPVSFALLLVLAAGAGSLTLPGKGLAAEVISKYALMLERIFRGTAYLLLGWMLHGFLERSAAWQRCALLLASSVLLVPELMLGWTLAFPAVILFSLLGIRLFAVPGIEKLLAPILYCGEHSLQIMAYHYLILWPLEKMWMLQIFGENYNRWLFFALNLSTTWLMILAVEMVKKGMQKQEGNS